MPGQAATWGRILLPILCLAALLTMAGPPTSADAARCGGLNQRPCKTSEAPKPCQFGLTVIARQCKRPRKDPVRTLTCGGRNRSPCTKPPACDRGLVVLRGRCVTPPKED